MTYLSILNRFLCLIIVGAPVGCATMSFDTGDAIIGVGGSEENVALLKKHSDASFRSDYPRPQAKSRDDAVAVKEHFCNGPKQKRSLKHRIVGSVVVSPGQKLSDAAEIKRELLEAYRAKAREFFNHDHDKCSEDGFCGRVGDSIDLFVADYDESIFNFDQRLFTGRYTPNESLYRDDNHIILVYFPREKIFRIGPRKAFAEVSDFWTSKLKSKQHLTGKPLKLSATYLAEIGAFKRMFRQRKDNISKVSVKKTIALGQPTVAIETKVKEAVGKTPEEVIFEVEADLSDFCANSLPADDFETK